MANSWSCIVRNEFIRFKRRFVVFRCILYIFLCLCGFSQHCAAAQQVDLKQKSIVAVKKSLEQNKQELIDTLRSQQQTLTEIGLLKPNPHHTQVLSKVHRLRCSWLTEKDYLRYPAPTYKPYFKLSSDTTSSSLEFHGWLQADQDIFFNAAGVGINNGLTDTTYTTSTVDRLWLRRIRPSLEGTFADYFNFLINPDFGEGEPRLFDGFIDINYLRAIGLQSGLQMSLLSGIENFFDNFSYLSRAYTMEMSNSAMMAPDREVGFVIHGSFGPSGNEPYYRGLSYLGFDDMFSYQFGMFNGTADNADAGFNLLSFDKQITNSIQNKAFEARVFINPFIDDTASILQHLGIGMAGSRENVHNQVHLPDLVSIGQNTIFQYTQLVPLANGLRYRLHPQVVWSLGPIGLLADWAHTTQTLCNGKDKFGIYCPVNGEHITQRNNASQAQLIYNLTQESFNLFHLIPNNNFHPFESGAYGAWQTVFRVTKLSLDKNVFQKHTRHRRDYYPYADPTNSVQASNSWSVGINWFWNDNFRVTTEYDHTQFIGGFCKGSVFGDPCESGIVANRPAEKIFMQRFQLTF